MRKSVIIYGDFMESTVKETKFEISSTANRYGIRIGKGFLVLTTKKCNRVLSPTFPPMWGWVQKITMDLTTDPDGPLILATITDGKEIRTLNVDHLQLCDNLWTGGNAQQEIVERNVGHESNIIPMPNVVPVHNCRSKKNLSFLAATNTSWGLCEGDGGERTEYFKCKICGKIFSQMEEKPPYPGGDSTFSDFSEERRLTEEIVMELAPNCFGRISIFDMVNAGHAKMEDYFPKQR